jgi:hypothetical protein
MIFERKNEITGAQEPKNLYSINTTLYTMGLLVLET